VPNLAVVISRGTMDCSALAKAACLSAYNATITNTTHYAIGELDVVGTQNQVPLCEVHASVRYGTNSTLNFALWLPDATEYSSRFMAVGNGGFAGLIPYSDMMIELNSGLGFAVAGGDAGHLDSENDAGAGPGSGAPGVYQPFLHDEDQLKAWLQDAIGLLTPASKALIGTFYGSEADFSYFRGCSAGGGQGLSLAEFYPDLFDGVIAGCSANWFTHLMLSFLWNANHTDTDSTRLSDSTLDFIQASVIDKCDKNDGVEDRLIENPLDCEFDVSSLACKSGSPSNTTCLTPDQLSAAKALYQGPVRSDDPNVSLYPGLSLGSEAGWGLPQVQAVLSNAFSVPILQNTVYNNLSYDVDTFNWASDVEFLDEKAGPLINSIKTDLSPFRKEGGKMIVWTGWADPNIAPLNSLRHVEAITRDTLGEGTSVAENDFVKLVMVPGGGHCGANVAKYPYVPATYDFSTAMVDWVENGKAPVEGIKSWGPTNGDDRTRKLCTWPQVAKLNEGGDVDDWESYTCG
jgi:feruloyl esterase